MNRKRMITALTKIIEANIEIIKLRKEETTDPKSKSVCNKAIRISNKAIEMLPHIKHIEILEALYNSLIAPNERYFMMVAPVIASKNTTRWDSSEKGFTEFLEENEKARQKWEEEQKTKEAYMKAVKQAQETGGKVEWIKDQTTGKVVPTVINGDNNA